MVHAFTNLLAHGIFSTQGQYTWITPDVKAELPRWGIASVAPPGQAEYNHALFPTACAVGYSFTALRACLKAPTLRSTTAHPAG